MTRFKFIHNLSIKNKVIGITLFVSFLVLSIGFVFIANWNISKTKSEIQASLALNAKLVGNYCIVPLTFGDNEQAIEVLSRLRYIDFIETGCLYDKEGTLFACYPDTLNKKAYSAFPEQQNNMLKHGYFYVHEPVLYQNEMYGTIFIKASSEPLAKVRKNLLFMLSGLTLVLIFLSTILASWMQSYISLPIISLKNHFDRIAVSQDYSARIAKQNNDEIGDLYDEFNNLINQIQNHSLERDKAELKLKESREKLDLALQGGDIGIWEWDLKTDIRIWDSKMEKMFGLKEGTFKQTYEAFKECLHPDDIVHNEKAIQDAINDIAPYDIIYRTLWKNKEIKFIRAKALISKDLEQKTIKMVGVCFDVTEIKEAEMELKKHRETLADLVKERTKKLEEKNKILENFNELFVDREFRIKELRDELEILKSDKKIDN